MEMLIKMTSRLSGYISVLLLVALLSGCVGDDNSESGPDFHTVQVIALEVINSDSGQPLATAGEAPSGAVIIEP